jgi:hypothetical protein
VTDCVLAVGETGDGRLGRFWLVLAGTAGPFVQFVGGPDGFFWSVPPGGPPLTAFVDLYRMKSVAAPAKALFAAVLRHSHGMVIAGHRV